MTQRDKFTPRSDELDDCSIPQDGRTELEREETKKQKWIEKYLPRVKVDSVSFVGWCWERPKGWGQFRLLMGENSSNSLRPSLPGLYKRGWNHRLGYCRSSRDDIKVRNVIMSLNPLGWFPTNADHLQMKLVLILLSCLVGVSYQDGYYVWPIAARDQLYYANGQSADYHKTNKLKVIIQLSHGADRNSHRSQIHCWELSIVAGCGEIRQRWAPAPLAEEEARQSPSFGPTGAAGATGPVGRPGRFVWFVWFVRFVCFVQLEPIPGDVDGDVDGAIDGNGDHHHRQLRPMRPVLSIRLDHGLRP